MSHWALELPRSSTPDSSTAAQQHSSTEAQSTAAQQQYSGSGTSTASQAESSHRKKNSFVFNYADLSS